MASQRIDKSWVVVDSVLNAEHDRCVDFFKRPDGTYGFDEFRRDVEDRGLWTPVAFFSGKHYPTREAAEADALAFVPWLQALRG